MKITKTQLKQIIKEELSQLLEQEALHLGPVEYDPYQGATPELHSQRHAFATKRAHAAQREFDRAEEQAYLDDLASGRQDLASTLVAAPTPGLDMPTPELHSQRWRLAMDRANPGIYDVE